MTKLACPDCQHENEPERIYCHDCGARLDRTKLAAAGVPQGNADVDTQKHLKKMFSRRRGQGKQIALKLGQILLGAAALGAVIVMALPPDLPPAPKSYSFAPMINMDLVSAASSHQGTALVYNEEQVNSYIAATLRRKDSPAGQGYFPLRRIFVRFDEGLCEVNSERQIFGYSIYSGGSYRVKVEQGKIQSNSTSGYIGRMPIHPTVMKYAGIIQQKAWDSLARERASVARLADIQFHPQSVTLVSAR